MLTEANPADVKAATKCFGQVASAASGLKKLKPLPETVTFNTHKKGLQYIQHFA